jgi:hypothetical protein
MGLLRGGGPRVVTRRCPVERLGGSLIVEKPSGALMGRAQDVGCAKIRIFKAIRWYPLESFDRGLYMASLHHSYLRGCHARS